MIHKTLVLTNSMHLLIIFLTSVSQYSCQFNPVSSVARFLMEGTNQISLEPEDRENIFKEYDFIIVGAGTAGATLANRLTEVNHWKVLLIEAGMNENFIMDIPLLANHLQVTQANWKYRTMPSDQACLGFKNRRCNWPRGKVMGGSSVLNYMIYTRGNRRDYDNWEKMGNPGWGWNNVLEYFKKIENFNVPEFQNNEYHSTGGYLNVENPPYRTEVAKAWVKGALQAGHRYNDHNGKTQTGAAFLQVSMKNGTRHSSSRAYLHPISNRPNLHVIKFSMVTRVLIDPKTKTAYGVEVDRRGNRILIKAKKEIILSAGSIDSPKLLMLSGIGPKDHLKDLKIPVIKNLPVGYNLMDHIAPGGLQFVIPPQNISLSTAFIMSRLDLVFEWMNSHTGPMSVPGGCEAVVFIDLNNTKAVDGWADMELLFISGGINADPLLKENFGFDNKVFRDVYGPLGTKEAFMVFPMLMRPKSKGRIMLKSKDPYKYPLLYHNYLSHPEDVATVVAGIRAAIKIGKEPAMKKVGAKLYDVPIPACMKHGFDTDEYWECFARHFTFTIYHQSGTCKMGPAEDKTTVVDARLKVHGVNNLRVIDASIMPEIPAAHTNAPTYMIAEKGADMIKEDWGIPTEASNRFKKQAVSHHHHHRRRLNLQRG